MNRILIFLFFLFISSGFIAQEIVNEKHQIKINTAIEPDEKLAIEAFLDSVEYIELVKIEPTCYIDTFKFVNDSISIYRRCYAQSIFICSDCIINWDTTKTTHATKLKKEDFQHFFSITLNELPGDKFTMACYEPRHGVEFYNKNHEVISYLELCFECHGGHFSKYSPIIQGFSDENYIQLRELFKKYGLVSKHTEE
jgi:hypothetical protein